MRARTCLWHMASTVPASGRAAGSGDISFCTHAQGHGTGRSKAVCQVRFLPLPQPNNLASVPALPKVAHSLSNPAL